MEFEVSGVVWYWKGPAPFHFVTVSEEVALALKEIAPKVSYGWGMIPATVRIGEISVKTALWPKDCSYIVPLKDALRKSLRIEIGDKVDLVLVLPNPFA